MTEQEHAKLERKVREYRYLEEEIKLNDGFLDDLGKGDMTMFAFGNGDVRHRITLDDDFKRILFQSIRTVYEAQIERSKKRMEKL